MVTTTPLADPFAGTDRETLIATIHALRQALDTCIQEKDNLDNMIIELNEQLDMRF